MTGPAVEGFGGRVLCEVDGQRFVFVHGRRAGGKSIKALLAPYCLPGMEHYLHSGVLSGREDSRPQVGVWNRGELDGVPIIANVRNPFDRTVSAWRHFGLGRRTHGHRVGFEEFVRTLPSQDDWLGWIHATATYTELMVDQEGPMWTHLIRYETLEADVAKVVAELGLGPVDVPHIDGVRASRSAALLRADAGRPGIAGLSRRSRDDGTYRAFYSRVAREEVERRFRVDLERFGYRF